jgi:predicted permease
MAPSGLFESFVGAIQASLSVLLVVFYGGIAAKLKLLTSDNTKAVSKICVRMFLPALLLTKIGSELHAGSGSRYGIIVLWAAATHVVSFLIGMFAHYVLKLPGWTTVALMFNNTTSYPLLLIEALSETGILQSLIVTDESTKDAVERAKSYFLVYATISSCLTFAIGPRLIDTEHAPDEEEDSDDEDEGGLDGPDERDDDLSRDPEANERTGLLSTQTEERSSTNSFFPSIKKPTDLLPHSLNPNRRSSLVSKTRWKQLSPRTRWWLLFVGDFFNAPLLGAILGAVIGLTPPLKKAFFSDAQDGGIFSAWLTASWKTIGNVFVPLPVVIAGVSLYTSVKDAKMTRETARAMPWGTWSFILAVRFVLWPAASISLVYALASRTGLLGDDPMLWFTMAMMPTGPPAMKLITLIQVSGGNEEDEHSISRLLTVSDVATPCAEYRILMSCSCRICSRRCSP